jgi:preprotein translocase subunit SecB
MDSTKAPGIRIDQIIVEGFSFKKNEQLDLGKTYNVNIAISNNFQPHPDGDKARLIETVKISEQSSNLFELELSYGLYAAIIESERNMTLQEFMENNAPAIVYQFARETILTMTQKAGIPLVLPPMNLIKVNKVTN